MRVLVHIGMKVCMNKGLNDRPADYQWFCSFVWQCMELLPIGAIDRLTL